MKLGGRHDTGFCVGGSLTASEVSRWGGRSEPGATDPVWSVPVKVPSPPRVSLPREDSSTRLSPCTTHPTPITPSFTCLRTISDRSTGRLPRRKDRTVRTIIVHVRSSTVYPNAESTKVCIYFTVKYKDRHQVHRQRRLVKRGSSLPIMDIIHWTWFQNVSFVFNVPLPS